MNADRLLALAALVAGSLFAPAVARGADDADFFREYVEPLLKRRCYECHSHDAGEASGGLVLDSRAGWQVGGDSGPSVTPGKPDESLLIKVVRYDDPHLQMPPEGKLSADEIGLLEKWVRDGAADPRTDGKAAARVGIDVEAGKRWWAFRSLKREPLGESLSARVDRRIDEKLDEAGLSALPEAEPATLLRRVYFDLIGLPPDAAAVREFVAACEKDRDAALAAVVDDLLSRPQFGEKWGRHWLDVARYADSNGSSHNVPFREAWRYRNWVVAAINRDEPIDDFVRKQLAGDLLPAASPEERDENVIATGFLMLGSKVLGEFDKEQLTLDVVDEQLDVIGKSLLGLTVSCARCHDHKFDPIPQADYYALAGILASTVTLDDRLGGPKEDESDWSRRGLGPDGDERLRAFLRERRYEWVKATGKRFNAAKKLSELRSRRESESESSADADALAKAEAELRDAEQKLAALEAILPPFAMAPRESESPGDIPLRIRGVAASHGKIVPRGFLQVASFENQPTVDAKASGRRELAEWIASDDNPLTPRVFVNRVWKHLFREGLVRSVDNFGATGEAPTHPELLDELAARFVESGWRLKPLVRELTLSRAYRRKSGVAVDADPENRLLSCQHARRLEPEEIRDSLLLLTGELDPSPAAGRLDHLPIGDVSNAGEALPTSDSRRTIYQPVIRTLEPDVLQIFDAPNNAMTTGARARTIAAPQALYFMNSPFVQRAAERIASRVAIDESGDDRVETLVERVFATIVCRAPTEREKRVLIAYTTRQADGPAGLTRHDAMKLCQTVLASTQFQFVE